MHARVILLLLLLTMAFGPEAYGQMPCPVALVYATAEKDKLKLEFMNKGKVPIDQLSLACSPAGHNNFPNGICHVEAGLFYPSTVFWTSIDYVGATRNRIEISVAQLRLRGGAMWEPSPSNRCKVLRVTRKK